MAKTYPAGAFFGASNPFTGADLSNFYKTLPPFCRVVAVATSTSDSNITIEVRMPPSAGNMVFDKADWDVKTFNVDRDLPFARQKTAAALDAVDPNLSAFRSHRGGDVGRVVSILFRIFENLLRVRVHALSKEGLLDRYKGWGSITLGPGGTKST